MDYNYLSKSTEIYNQHKSKILERFQQRAQAYQEQILIDSKNITPRFKELMADLYYFLNTHKKILDAEESQLPTLPYEVRKKFCKELLDYYGQIFKNQMTHYANEVEKVCQDFSTQEHFAHKLYFQEILLELYVLQCPFTKRAYQKPHGYAGDFILMNMIAEDDPFTGNSFYQKCLQYFTVNSPSAAPVRNRITLIYNELCKKAAEVLKQRDEFRLFDVASGPSIPIQWFLQRNDESNNLNGFFLDQDSLSIDYLQNRLNLYKERFRRQSRFRYSTKKIQEVLMDQGMLRELADQDFIFSSGLFDYLSDDLAKMLIQALYALLSPGGCLLIGNLSDRSTGKVFQWYVNDWPIFFRTEAQIKSLAPQGVKIEILKEELGFNLFIKIIK